LKNLVILGRVCRLELEHSGCALTTAAHQNSGFNPFTDRNTALVCGLYLSKDKIGEMPNTDDSPPITTLSILTRSFTCVKRAYWRMYFIPKKMLHASLNPHVAVRSGVGRKPMARFPSEAGHFLAENVPR
jgi:hypothetical protein